VPDEHERISHGCIANVRGQACSTLSAQRTKVSFRARAWWSVRKQAALVEACVRRGVFVSRHHVEPMGGSAFSCFNCWKTRGKDLRYSHFSHPDEVREVWRAYTRRSGPRIRT